MSLERLQGVAFTPAIELKSTKAPEISDRIFTLFPIPSVDGVGWKVEFKAAWVAKQFTDFLEAADHDEICFQISCFRKLVETNGIARHPFEPLVRRMLVSTATQDIWPLKAMHYDSDQVKVKITVAPLPAEVLFAKVQRPVHRFHDLPPYFESGAYYWLYSPFVNAFIVDIKNNFAVPWIPQITTYHCKVHDIIQRLKA